MVWPLVKKDTSFQVQLFSVCIAESAFKHKTEEDKQSCGLSAGSRL